MALNVSYRHQTKRVKVTPGTTMFEVLESAREHFNLNPTGHYELLHRNRTIDLSLPFRLTGISNMATIELLVATTSSSSSNTTSGETIRVCIQLPDGKRMQHTFKPQDSLEEILQHFKLLPSPFNREILSETFATTTLKELGLMSGSAIFRVQIAFGSMASSAPATTPQATPSFTATSFSSTSSTSHASMSSLNTTNEMSITTSTTSTSTIDPSSQKELTPASSEVVVEQEPKRRVQFQEEDSKVSSLGAYEALQLLRNNCFDAISRTAVLTLMKILTNILSFPENEKLRSIRLANAAFDRTVGKHPGGRAFLLSSGFVLNEESQCLELNTSMTLENRNLLIKALELLEKEANDLQIEPFERPVVVQPKQQSVDSNFDPFKPQITRMQIQPRGPSATEVLVENLKAKQEQILHGTAGAGTGTGTTASASASAACIPQRNTIVLLPQQKRQQQQHSQVLWESEEDSSSDSHLIISSIKARREEMEKSQNFRTQAMRELDELKRRKVFQQTVIRIQFPDRIVLQAIFHPNETIQAIIDHVKECLDPQVRHHQVDFYLYVTPPTERLIPEKTLSDSNLVPAALTYLSWTKAPPTPTDSTSTTSSSTSSITNAVGFYLDSKFLESQTGETLDYNYYPKPLALVIEESKKDPDEESKAAASSVVSLTTNTKPKSKTNGKKPAWLKI